MLKDDLKEARRKNRETGTTSSAVPGDPDLLEQIRKLKQEKIKLMGENELLRKSARYDRKKSRGKKKQNRQRNKSKRKKKHSFSLFFP